MSNAREFSVVCGQGKEGKPVNLEPRWLKAQGAGSHFIQGLHREAGLKHSGRMVMKNWF